MMAPPKLPYFTGCGNSDVVAFTTEARRILANVSMDEGTAVEWLLQSLVGLPRLEVLPRLGVDVHTAEGVLEALHEAFGQQIRPGEILAKFYSRRQGKNEALLTYAQDLQQIAAKANQQQQGSLSDAQLRDKFVEGLHSASLRREVRRLCQKEGYTYLQARAEALRWQRDEEPHDEATTQQVVTTASDRDTQIAQAQKQIADLQKQIADYQKKQLAKAKQGNC